MKKILLSAITCLSIATLSFGQNFTVLYGDTARSVMTGSTVQVHNYIINNSSAPATYEWKFVDNDFPTGWEFNGLCDNNLCYTSINSTTNTTFPVGPNDTMHYYTTFDDDGTGTIVNGSSAWVRAALHESGDMLNTKILTFIATKGTTSAITVTKSEDNIVVFPNPAKSSVNVIYNADMGVKNIGIYNLIGKMVSVYKVGNTSAKLDVENLPSGIYFIRLFNAQGKVVGTRKFTCQ